MTSLIRGGNCFGEENQRSSGPATTFAVAFRMEHDRAAPAYYRIGRAGRSRDRFMCPGIYQFIHQFFGRSGCRYIRSEDKAGKQAAYRTADRAYPAYPLSHARTFDSGKRTESVRNPQCSELYYGRMHTRVRVGRKAKKEQECFTGKKRKELDKKVYIILYANSFFLPVQNTRCGVKSKKVKTFCPIACGKKLQELT